MSSYDLIAFDMDGTLLDSSKTVREDSLSAIKKAVSQNKYVVLSTGRNLKELESTFEAVPEISYAIAISGGLVYDVHARQIVYSKALPDDICLTLLQLSQEYDVMIHLHSLESIVQKDKEAHMAKYSMGVYQQMFDKLTLKAENLSVFYLKEKFPVFKFNFYCQSPAQRLEILEKVNTLNLPITISFAETASLEVSALGISKGSGLKELCNRLNIPIERTIAVGDGENDLEILKTAGLPIAMGNALDCVKSVCKVTVSDCDGPGCSEAIEKYLLS